MEALELGLEVKLGNHIWALMNGTDAADRTGKMLCIKGWNETKQQPHYMNPDLSFNTFLRLCDKLTEKDLLAIGADVVLNQTYRRRS